MALTGPSTRANAGWYPDPSDAGRIRYWDGSSWTQHSLVAPPTQTSAWTGAPRPAAVGTRDGRAWWQTWWAIVPGLLLCLPIGLVGLWLRKGTSKLTKWIVTACAAVLVVGAIASPDTNSDADSTTPATPPSASPSALPSPAPSTKPASKPRIQSASVPVLTGMTLAEAREQPC